MPSFPQWGRAGGRAPRAGGWPRRGSAAPAGPLRSALAAQTQLTLALVLAVLAPLGVAAATQGSEGAARRAHRRGSGQHRSEGSTTRSAAAGPSHNPLPAAAAPLFRIVGCRSRGAGAYRQGPHVREVAIGFDDGPATDSAAFVAMLERAHATATFFMIGRQLGPVYGSLLMRELRDGDALGDHTFSHPDLTRGADVRGQLQWTLGAIRSLSGYTPCVFRPPYGAYDASVVSIARSLGLATVMWNVDPRDWALPGTGAIRRTVLAQVQPGSIIISHDGGGPRGQTLAAYPSIIAALRARGYRIVTIPQLLGFRPVYRPCIKLCAGLGQPPGALPRDAIIERAR